MNLYAQTHYEKILESVIPKTIQNDTFIMIDEADKYFYHYSNYKNTEYLKKLKEDEEKVDFANFVLNIKHEFLQYLLKIIGKDCDTGSLVLIFCANNFDFLFEDIDMRHYESLFDRFNKFDFEMCQKNEIIAYVQYYHSKFDGLDIQEKREEIEKILKENLKEDVAITYRQLFYICLKYHYQSMEIAKAINIWTEEDQKKEKEKKFEKVKSAEFIPVLIKSKEFCLNYRQMTRAEYEQTNNFKLLKLVDDHYDYYKAIELIQKSLIYETIYILREDNNINIISELSKNYSFDLIEYIVKNNLCPYFINYTYDDNNKFVYYGVGQLNTGTFVMGEEYYK